MIVYSLSDPTTGAVRYVGITSRPLPQRLKGHLNRARSGEETHRSAWVRSLLAASFRPVIATLEETDDPDRERFWISKLRAEGFDLTNGTDGGEGSPNLAPEVRERIGAATRARMQTAAAREVIAEANRARVWSPESRAKKSAYMKARMALPENRQAVSDQHKGVKKSLEMRKRLSAATTGKPKHPAAVEKMRATKLAKGKAARCEECR